MERQRRTKPDREKSCVVEKSSGGRTTERMTSGDSSTRGTPGTNETAAPATASSSGGCQPRREATIVRARAAKTTTRSWGETPGPVSGATARSPSGAGQGWVMDMTSRAVSSCSSLTSPRSTNPRSTTASRTVEPVATACLATLAAAS